MNFLELCQRVASESGLSASGPASVVGQNGIHLKVVRWVQRAYNEIQTARPDWNFLFSEGSLTLQKDRFEFDPRFHFVNWEMLDSDSIKVRRGNTLAPVTFMDYPRFTRVFHPQIQQAGVALEYYTVLPNDTIRFNGRATEDTEIFLSYYRKPFQLAQNTDVPVFGSQYHDAILYKALMYYAADEEAGNIYQDAQANFTAHMRRLESNEHQHEMTMPPPLA
jgi:hypothetical protein